MSDSLEKSGGITVPSSTSTEISTRSPPQTQVTNPNDIFISPVSNPQDMTADTITRTSGNETITTSSERTSTTISKDPLSLEQYKRSDLDKKTLRAAHPKGKPRKLKTFYTRQNELIDAYLGSTEEEAAGDLDMGLCSPWLRTF